MDPQLTNEQSQLIETNFDYAEKLTWYWKKKFMNLSYEDCYDVAIHTLIRTARRYNPDKGCKFTTFYCNNMKMAIYRLLRYRKAQKRVGELYKISIDTKIGSKDDNDDITILDAFSTVDDYSFFHSDQIERVWDYLNQREQYCIHQSYFMKRDQSDIATNLGVSQVQVSRIIKKGLNKMRNHLKKEEVFA